MNSKTLRRLAGDHGSLHTAGLPPNYLFPSNTDLSADLTSLDVLLCGPVGTPYAHGVWRLHLDIPPTYPAAAPTAFFRTRCWHPNVDESTGAVCVETLKRDWSSTLKLRDVLVTISCLLIQPNPASALNEEAGKLANEDWAGFCRRAKLMTEIHAAAPGGLAKEIREAQMRGEEEDPELAEKEPRLETRGKGKERVRLTPPASSKVQRAPLVEDEENKQHRGRSGQSESDESDWIPRPTRSPIKVPGPKYEKHTFGIRGLNPSVSLDDEAKRAAPVSSQAGGAIAAELQKSGSFTTMTSRRTTHPQTSLVIPISPNIATSQEATTAVPELLKYSHTSPFSVTQPDNQQDPLLTELSFTWANTEVQRGTGVTRNIESRHSIRKRSAGEDFERKREWELKRFQKAGCDLKRYNRGDFGARTGIGRL
ncbi:ubiquitin-conjugating enzyme/RWD-like protein [Boeremia exigua]|uniref:ubiquitin-conjugating enzyme/RWD-like protein n=1 Tax=Boeremia exigua TaxID=749465 RepID=UPI001E8CFDB9|nr:ubiquitin-conjugating enzyme/RWD-like protein [Boeremia exigua]KAH6614906.1 ubiquitin-conjugating enzyme/RWD-like protein [Boeremia exigua]